MSCDNSAINGMNPGMAGFIVAKKRVMELNDSMQQGIVYLLGAGPGDPGLMTVRGRELVEAAEVLAHVKGFLWASGLPATPCRRRKSMPCWSNWDAPGKKWCA